MHKISLAKKLREQFFQLTEQFFQLGVFIGKFLQGFLVLSQERKLRFKRAATFFWQGLLSGFRMSVRQATFEGAATFFFWQGLLSGFRMSFRQATFERAATFFLAGVTFGFSESVLGRLLSRGRLLSGFLCEC